MATIQDINSSIIAGHFDNDQLDSIIMAIKFARSQLTKENTRSMVLGSRVEFVNPRSGRVVVGNVVKVARKFISVREPASMTTWRVPANMLKVAE